MHMITEFADVEFKACNDPGPTRFICTLENGPAQNVLLDDELAFRLQLKPGITLTQAQAVAEYLNQHVAALSITY